MVLEGVYARCINCFLRKTGRSRRISPPWFRIRVRVRVRDRDRVRDRGGEILRERRKTDPSIYAALREEVMTDF